MTNGERLYRALAVAVVGAIVAATAALIAALALISRRPSDAPPPSDPDRR
jgi:hypothetical protein